MSVSTSRFGIRGFNFPIPTGGGGGGGVITPSLRRDLLHSPAEVYQKLLIDLGLGVAPGGGAVADTTPWTTYATVLPDSPDSVLACYDTAPKELGRENPGRETVEHFGVQILIRGATHPLAQRKARMIANALDNSVLNTFVTIAAGPLVGTATYLIKSANRQGLIYLGADKPKSNRKLLTINLTSSIHRTS